MNLDNGIVDVVKPWDVTATVLAPSERILRLTRDELMTGELTGTGRTIASHVSDSFLALVNLEIIVTKNEFPAILRTEIRLLGQDSVSPATMSLPYSLAAEKENDRSATTSGPLCARSIV